MLKRLSLCALALPLALYGRVARALCVRAYLGHRIRLWRLILPSPIGRWVDWSIQYLDESVSWGYGGE